MLTLVADVDLHPRRTESVEHRLVADVATGDGVAHLGEHDRDRAHAGATHAHDMEPLRRAEIDRRHGRRDRFAPLLGVALGHR